MAQSICYNLSHYGFKRVKRDAQGRAYPSPSETVISGDLIQDIEGNVFIFKTVSPYVDSLEILFADEV
jgi:hypothetical protein